MLQRVCLAQLGDTRTLTPSSIAQSANLEVIPTPSKPWRARSVPWAQPTAIMVKLNASFVQLDSSPTRLATRTAGLARQVDMQVTKEPRSARTAVPGFIARLTLRLARHVQQERSRPWKASQMHALLARRGP